MGSGAVRGDAGDRMLAQLCPRVLDRQGEGACLSAAFLRPDWPCHTLPEGSGAPLVRAAPWTLPCRPLCARPCTWPTGTCPRRPGWFTGTTTRARGRLSGWRRREGPGSGDQGWYLEYFGGELGWGGEACLAHLLLGARAFPARNSTFP